MTRVTSNILLLFIICFVLKHYFPFLFRDSFKVSMYHRRSWSRSRWIGQNASEKSEHGMLKMTSLVLRFSSNSLCLGMCCICRCLKLSVPISTPFTPISYSPRQAFTCPATVWGLTDGESDNLAVPMDVLAEMDKVSCTSGTTFPFIPHWFWSRSSWRHVFTL